MGFVNFVFSSAALSFILLSQFSDRSLKNAYELILEQVAYLCIGTNIKTFCIYV